MNKPRVTLIVPCRNEEKFIEKVIKSVISQTYPKDRMEVLFIDGQSEDRTREIIELYSQKYPFIKLLINPYKYVPQAMNIGIKAATGEIIIRMDAHSEYPEDYVEKLVYWLKKLNADNVGGVWITTPPTDSLKAKAIALALSHPFGVGNSLFRTAKNLKKHIEVDTVPFGCYLKEIFDKIGLYDERLVRNQDIELNKRLRKSGGKIYLIPDIKIKYYARDTWRKLWKNNFENGRWVVLTAFLTKDFKSLSLRHFIPLIFVLYFVLLPVFFKSFRLLIVPGLMYLILNILVSVLICFKERQAKLFPFLTISFLVLHFSYGIGSLKALFEIITKLLK